MLHKQNLYIYIYQNTVTYLSLTHQSDKDGRPNSRIATNKNKLSYTASAVKNLENRSLEFPLSRGFTKTIIDINVPTIPKEETNVKIIPSTMKMKLSTGASLYSWSIDSSVVSLNVSLKPSVAVVSLPNTCQWLSDIVLIYFT